MSRRSRELQDFSSAPRHRELSGGYGLNQEIESLARLLARFVVARQMQPRMFKMFTCKREIRRHRIPLVTRAPRLSRDYHSRRKT